MSKKHLPRGIFGGALKSAMTAESISPEQFKLSAGSISRFINSLLLPIPGTLDALLKPFTVPTQIKLTEAWLLDALGPVGERLLEQLRKNPPPHESLSLTGHSPEFQNALKTISSLGLVSKEIREGIISLTKFYSSKNPDPPSP